MYSSTLIETRLGYFGEKAIYQLWICMIGCGLYQASVFNFILSLGEDM